MFGDRFGSNVQVSTKSIVSAWLGLSRMLQVLQLHHPDCRIVILSRFVPHWGCGNNEIVKSRGARLNFILYFFFGVKVNHR